MCIKPLGNKAIKRLIEQVKSVHHQDNPFAGCLPIFLVVGQAGIGKTTLITNVVERLRDEVPSRKIRGFYTSDLRDGNSRIGYEVVTMDGKRGLLAHADESKGTSGQPLVPMGNYYKLDIASFEKLALPSLEIKRGTSLYVIDEIGKMELSSPKFFPAVVKVINSRIPVIASMKTPRPRNDNITEMESMMKIPNTVCCPLSRANRGDNEDLIFTLLNRIT